MRTEIDVVNSLTKMLEDNFSDIQMSDTDIEEGFKRPCFFIDVLDIDSTKIGELLSDNIQIKLYYFAPKRTEGYLNLLEIKDKLRILLSDNIRFGAMSDDGTFLDGYDFVIGADDLQFHINQKDKTLECDFVVQLVEEDEREDGTENIEELDFNFQPTTEPSEDSEDAEDSSDADFISQIEESDKNE